MIEPTYVTYEQAKLLKEKGFDVKCTYYYDCIGDVGSGVTKPNWNIAKETLYSRPEHWQVVEWLRIVKGIWVCCIPTYNPKKFQFRLYRNDNGTMAQIYGTFMGKEFSYPQKAYSAAFDYILTKLKNGEIK